MIIWSLAQTQRKRYKIQLIHLAHRLVTEAVRTGYLIPKSCEVCDSKEVNAHHDNYENPLIVRWLCRTHHREWHRRYKTLPI